MVFRRYRWGRGASLALFVVLVVGLAMPAARGLAQLDYSPGTPTALGPAVPPEIDENVDGWPIAQGNLAGHRSAQGSPIDSSNVDQLEVAWEFPIEATNPFGAITSTPVVVGEVVYIQDMLNNVFALDRESGEVIWEKEFNIPTEGPNGVAVAYGMVYGGLGDAREAFALDAETGEEVWRALLSNNDREGIDMAPTVYNNTVYISTVPGNEQGFYRGGGKGILYALDAGTGTTLWQFDTTTDNLWGNPSVNSGGGLWYPPSVDEDGNLYFGTGNAGPWPGTEEYPNGTSRPGPNDYASSLVSLDPAGVLRWHYNADPHDLLDHDFQLTPILATTEVDGAERQLAIGAGKTGTVVAADAATGEILWEVEVGEHNEFANVQEIPEGETVEALPGPIGGVETFMAYADGTVFVPVINAPAQFTNAALVLESFDLTTATGELVALNAADGSVKWQVEIPSMVVASATVANDVVFTGALDGVIRAYDTETGDELWTHETGVGLNAPPAVAGDMVILPAGGPFIPATASTAEADVEATPGGAAGAEPAETVSGEAANRLIAFRLPAGAVSEDATAEAAADAEATPAGGATPAATPPAATAGTPTAATPEAGGEEVVVDIRGLKFIPAEIEIAAGTTVRWPNSDTVEHTVTEVGDNPRFDSGLYGPGESFEFTFDEPGTYEYFCIPHPFMRGTVVVT